MFTYFKANRTAGYSGFVLYIIPGADDASYWMIPGTFFDDWDN
jgi:hypothetical protein